MINDSRLTDITRQQNQDDTIDGLCYVWVVEGGQNQTPVYDYDPIYPLVSDERLLALICERRGKN